MTKLQEVSSTHSAAILAYHGYESKIRKSAKEKIGETRAMSRFVLFQMWGPVRQSLIERHQFYAEQAQTRLLGQFKDIEGEADRAADEWLERSSRRFDPDRHDIGEFYERAYDEGLAHYQLLSDMRDQTHLSIAAGLFHEWDKQLRDWMVREILHWHQGSEVRAKIWSQDIGGLADLFACLGWDFRNQPYYALIDACRLVVNVYKHGEGVSLDDLKKRYPRYLTAHTQQFNENFIDYQDLRVTRQDIQEFSEAIISFWNDVPDNIWNDDGGEVPKWFEKAWLKDNQLRTRKLETS